MRRRYDKIIVVDLEATCWNGNQPHDQTSDIIEIGLAVLDTWNGDIEKSAGLFVQPTRSKVSPFCTELTTITAEMLKGAHPLDAICNQIKKEFAPGPYMWAAWGEFDRVRLQKECTELGAEFPFSERYLNVKDLFTIMTARTKGVGLSKAVAHYGLSFDGTAHRGVDDAINTAHVLHHILKGER